MLARLATEHGGRTALTCADRSFSYAELESISSRVAAALKDMGVSRGDRVALALANSPEFIFIYLGTVKMGAIAVPLDPKLKYAELSSLLKHARPKVLFAGDPVLGLVAPHRDRFAPMLMVACGTAASPGTVGFDDLLERVPAKPVKAALAAADIAQIHYTSGPAFRPLGVMLSHRAVVDGVTISTEGFKLTPDDVVLLFALPLHHIYGLTILLLSAFAGGSRVVLLAGNSFAEVWRTVAAEKVSVILGVPYVFALAGSSAEKEDAASYDLTSLRLCVSGGAPLALAVKERFEEALGMTLHQLYGLTESTVHLTLTSLAGTHTPGSVGRLLKGWQLKIVDRAGNECAAGQTGELLLRGPLTDGYYRDPEATARLLRDGWLHTGDLGHVTPDGEIFLTGLAKDVFIVKGQNVYPEDIEAILETYPNISEAVTFRLPDDVRGDRIEAVVTLKNASKITDHELTEHCRKYLANYKVPKRIRLIAFLPRDASGNVSRDAVRRVYYGD
jgi:long-chain acyl-CoA synthetase